MTIETFIAQMQRLPQNAELLYVDLSFPMLDDDENEIFEIDWKKQMDIRAIGIIEQS